MTDTYELDILGNSLDSLKEAFIKYKAGKEEETREFKFCILNLVHAMELFLKHCVAEQHPLLVYVTPHSPGKRPRTITLDQAISTLESCNFQISKEFKSDIGWLKDLRNDIEHHKFSLKEDEVDEYVGRVLSALIHFNDEHKIFDFKEFLEDIEAEIGFGVYDIEHLTAIYAAKLQHAVGIVRDEHGKATAGYRQKELHLVDWSATTCNECSHETMIPDEDSATGYKCTFCGSTEPDELEVEEECDLCGTRWPLWDLVSIKMDGGEADQLCPYCRHDPEYVKDTT